MPDAPKNTVQLFVPDGWTSSDLALFVVLTDWIDAALGRALRERSIEPDAETISEVRARTVEHVAFIIEKIRGGVTPAPLEPRQLVEQFARHVLVHHFGSPEDRRREFRVVH